MAAIQKVKIGLQGYNLGDADKYEHNFVRSGYDKIENLRNFVNSATSQVVTLTNITSTAGVYVHYMSCTTSGDQPLRVGFKDEAYLSTPLKLYPNEGQVFRPGNTNLSTFRLITTSGYGAYVHFVAFGE